MTDQTKRMDPPPLEAVEPNCSLCHDQTTFEDDRFYCAECQVSWDAELFHLPGHGYWEEPDAAQCPALDPMAAAFNFATTEQARCRLDEGHDDLHRSEFRSWKRTVVDVQLPEPVSTN